ncbi:MAG: hypothetical protein ACIAQZ_14570 [Sedimentisphaeraceae bacterium JB056]
MENEKIDFILPNDSDIYVDNIVGRSKALINTGIWDGLEIVDLEIWLNNFKTKEEKYFSACVLDSLIYRSDKQMKSMMLQILERNLVDLTRIHPPQDNSNKNWYEALMNPDVDPKIRVVPVLIPGSPTKSGAPIARMYKKDLLISENWIIEPGHINLAKDQGVNCFIFIDDFMGTGVQFGTDFIMEPEYNRVNCKEEHKLSSIIRNDYVVYAPLVAHSEGIKAIKEEYSQIHIIAADILEESHDFFSEDAVNSGKFGGNSVAVAKKFYYDLLKKNNLASNKDNRRGYGSLGLTYFFQSAMPDNCLPILWKKTHNWHPLQSR